MNSKKRSFIVWLTSLILGVLIILITAFSEWFGITYIGDTTLLKVAKLVTRFNDWFGDSANALSVAAAFIYGALIIMAICGYYTLRSLHEARTSGADVTNALFTMSIILSLLVISIIVICNISINSETDGWLEDIFHLTSAPFFVLVFGIVGHRVNSKYFIESFTFSDLSPKNAPVGASFEKKELYCPKCKKTVPDSGKFCPTCGTELVASTMPCPQCGKTVAYDAAFCTNCGCDIAKYNKENGHYTCTCGNVIKKELLQKKQLKYCPQCGKEIKAAPKPAPTANGEYVCKCGTKISNPYLKYCPQCGKEIKWNDSPTQYLKGVCPACGNYRNNGAFCAICGHAIPPAESSSSTKSKKS